MTYADADGTWPHDISWLTSITPPGRRCRSKGTSHGGDTTISDLPFRRPSNQLPPRCALAAALTGRLQKRSSAVLTPARQIRGDDSLATFGGFRTLAGERGGQRCIQNDSTSAPSSLDTASGASARCSSWRSWSLSGAETERIGQGGRVPGSRPGFGGNLGGRRRYASEQALPRQIRSGGHHYSARDSGDHQP